MTGICLLLAAVLSLMSGACTRPEDNKEEFLENHFPSTDQTADERPARKVELRKIDGRYQLFRFGKPYYVKGACGHTELDLIRKAGGNSIRTYTALDLDTLLDQAHANGLSVMVGLWTGKIRDGFYYSNRKEVLRQREDVLEAVHRYKDHPAVLCWALGNEPAHYVADAVPVWQEMDTLAALVRAADPEHPITSVGEVKQLEDMVKYCPGLDFVSVNTASNLNVVPGIIAQLGVPYLIAEFTNPGYWESFTTEWGAAREYSIPRKYKAIKSAYQDYIYPDMNCLGSYVFFWGYKKEYTHTWFNFFMEDGSTTHLVDLMFELWGGKPERTNKSPVIDSLYLDIKSTQNPLYIQSGSIIPVSADARDPENDALTYHWEIVPEGRFFAFSPEPGLGWHELRPNPIPGLVLEQTGNRACLKAPPGRGAYRIFAYAYDGSGNGAYANIPFFVINSDLVNK